MSADADRHLDLVPDGRNLDVCPSLRTLVRDLPTAAAVVDFDGHAWIWNAAAETLFPPPPQHASTTYPLFSLGTQPWFPQAVAAARAGRGVDSISWRPRGLGGERFRLGIAMTPARGRDDRVVGMVALVSDHTHTERRRRRTLRRALRAEYILDAAPDGVIVHQSNRIVYANRAAVRLLGATHRRALLGEPIADRLSPFDGTQATLTRIDGTACTVEVRSATVRFRTRPATELTVREIESCLDTDDRRTEDQLRQAQRMEAIGRLAGGIAHDFSNLLTAIQGHVQFLLDELPLNHPSTQDAHEIKRSADRASTLTRQLLAFSRRQEMELREVDLNDIIGEMGLLLRRVINEDILLQTTFEPALWRVRADRGQIEQVLINLVVNARDALPQGGVVTIRTANVELDEEYAGRKLDVVSGQYVLLSVSDNGIGMDRETQSHIFEPFFTTKEPGKGTGLGLATVYGIVKQSDGHVWVYSEPGRGTTFKIYLPRVPVPAEARPAEPGRKECAQLGETILLVEDEDAVRALARRVLEGRGYTVLPAANGADALRIARQHEGTINLMLSDVVVPDMNGRAIGEQVVRVRPGIKLLFMSGYTDEDAKLQGVLEDGAPFLEKPFTPDLLARKVREVLGVHAKSPQTSG